MAKSSTKSRKKSKARLVSSKVVYRGPVFWVTTDHVLEPGGIKVRRDLIHHSGSIVVLAVDDTGETPLVLLERQYRHAAKDYLWELPAGRIDAGEQELQAAKRELIEETGYRAKRLKVFLEFFPTPGFLEEKMWLLLAEELTEGEAQPEEDERIEVKAYRVNELKTMIKKGELKDAKSIAGILYYLTFLR